MTTLSRRSFLGLLGAGAAGLALDPERLLWVPGAKKIFIPAPARVVAAAAFRRGDVFTIAGRYAINPLTWEPVTCRGEPVPQQFVVLEDVRAGQEVLARGATPSFTLEARTRDGWETHWRSELYNGEPLPPGDHPATPVGSPEPTTKLVATPNQHRGFVLAPPDRREEGEARARGLIYCPPANALEVG